MEEKKNHELDFTKIKTFALQKTLLREQKVKTQWNKIFVNHVSNGGHISRTYKGLSKVIYKKAAE